MKTSRQPGANILFEIYLGGAPDIPTVKLQFTGNAIPVIMGRGGGSL